MYILLIAVAALSLLLFTVLAVKSGYASKLLFKLGWIDRGEPRNWTAFSWESCLKKMNCTADVVFFGDSIIRGGDFQMAFPQHTIVNLGCSGDTLTGMLGRVSTVQAIAPDKVFLLGGINGLTDRNLKLCVNRYNKLIDALQGAIPDLEIYIHSVLPIASHKERGICKNKTIKRFNGELLRLAEARGLIFVDLYPLFEHLGEIDISLTTDGVHLTPEAYDIWVNTLRPYLEK